MARLDMRFNRHTTMCIW